MKIGRHEFETPRVVRTIAYTVIGLTAYQGYLHTKLYIPDHKYVVQLFGLIAGICLALFILSLRKLFPSSVYQQIGRGLARGYGFLCRQFDTLGRKIRKLLRIPEKSGGIRRRDERSFVFDLEDDGRYRGFRRGGESLSWKNLETNDQKMRFLFIKFVIKFKKKGYYYNTILTPHQQAEKWKLEEGDGGFMFPLYTFARYSGGKRPITDEEIEMSQKIAK